MLWRTHIICTALFSYLLLFDFVQAKVGRFVFCVIVAVLILQLSLFALIQTTFQLCSSFLFLNIEVPPF